MKSAIVVLTRGYNNILKYNKLINRNKHIAINFYLKLENPENYDIIIFHEGNITLEQQKYIQSQTPKLPLIFKSITFYNTNIQNKYLCPPTYLSNKFSPGYKNMCFFWSILFLDYLKDYLYIIRIDEDCLIKSIPTNIINTYIESNIYFASPYFQGPDDPNVTVGITKFFLNFLQKNNIKGYNSNVTCPYTNVSIINIQYFRQNSIVQKVLQEIILCGCIFSNRWGDLPIWGYILNYLIHPHLYKQDKSICYFHGSHNTLLN